MIEHMEALQSLAGMAVRDVYLMDATGATRMPYAVLGLGYQHRTDWPVCGESESLNHEVRVTVAAGSGEALVRARQAVQSALSPRGGAATLEVPGRSATVRWVRFEMADVDRDVSSPATNGHAHYAVDTYRIDSDPS